MLPNMNYVWFRTRYTTANGSVPIPCREALINGMYYGQFFEKSYSRLNDTGFLKYSRDNLTEFINLNEQANSSLQTYD